MASSTLFFELQVGLEQLVGASGTQDFETWASVIRDKLADQNNCAEDFYSVSNIIVEMLTGKSLEKDLEPTVVQSIFDGLNLCIYNSTILDESVKDQPGKQDVLAEPIVEGMADGGRDSVNDDECAFLEKITDEICGSATESWNETFEQDQVHNDYEKFLEATAVQIAEKALENISLEDGRGDLQNSSSVAPASDAPMS
uniref:Pre-rRNA-processing protein TSR2 homolog n=1 Tax=Ditylenchus dipsaci TaxID=166011 RepID=A0A915E964_9BILA